MPRWEPDGLERLQAAALELFAEQGFERTTVAEIAWRAGLTQRTFFNHFADKREVLFGLSSDFQDEVVRGIAACAAAASPLDTVVHALTAADTMFEERRVAVMRRHEVVESNPELQERELSKGAALAGAIACALQARGVDPETALLTAGAGLLVQQTAIRRWTQPAETRPLRELLPDALHELHVTISRTCRAYYDQHRAKGSTHHQALRALSNRLVGVLHGCLRHRTNYDEATAWPLHHPTAFNLTRAAGTLASPLPRQGHHRHDPRPAHHRPRQARPLSTPADPAPAHGMALA